MSTIPIFRRPVVVGLAACVLLFAPGCASTTPTPTPTEQRSAQPATPAGAASRDDSCTHVYAVGAKLTQILSCSVKGVPTVVGTYNCLGGSEQLGYLDSSAGLSEPVWFVIPGVVTAVVGSLKTDPAYAAAFEKCTGKALVDVP